jgi:glutamyl-tRNA synthetase
MSETIRTRMAPSPTGEYHVGHIATLLKNYAFAKKHGGKFILRIEDTDQERKVDGAVDRIMHVIRSYGLDWDEGPDTGGPYAPYTQSERLHTYKEYVDQLVTNGKAYHCFCSKERLDTMRAEQIAQNQLPKYDKHCRYLDPAEVQKNIAAGMPSVIRLSVPDAETISFTDLIRGNISIESSNVDDQVLFKSDGFPTYHLAVVVDDHLMNITHVLRGEEWISSTPKHILLYTAFGWQPPVYAHIPVFLNPDGKGKMSKRKGTVAAQSFLENGYLPEAMLNFFMILGWAPKDQREVLTLQEYINEFEPSEISAKSVVFDLQKLNWLNGVYIRNLSIDELTKRIEPFLSEDFPKDKLTAILPLVMERLVTLKDVTDLTEFFYRDITVDKQELVKKADAASVIDQLQQTVDAVSSIAEWNLSGIEQAVRSLQEAREWKKSQYFMMLRVAVTGRTATPPLFETIEVLGAEVVKKRLKQAISLIS